MSRITIDLNPQKKHPLSAAMQNLISYTPLLGLCVIFGLMLVLLLQIVIIRKSYLRHYNTLKWEKWKDKFSQLSEIKKNIRSLSQEKDRLQKLIIPQHEISKILGGIFSALPKNIWLEKLNFNEGFINLEGNVIKWQEDYLVSLSHFIEVLQKEDYFSSKKINIKESRKIKFNGLEVLNFIIECRS
ncbi:MAG: hypothetical protein KBB01_00420 [Candidatus Omnitrophica bacterium]|jgi:Tfp pilus assembly protein PilN|nr:hypothetical protein [Candidatus Omnitrophota bacterium]